MKAVRDFVLPLAKPLFRAAALVALAAAIAAFVHDASLQAAAAHAGEATRRDELRAGSADDATRVRFETRYQALRAGGAIGPERRRDWVASVSEAAEARRLASVEYEFSPQQPVALETPAGQTPRYEFLASTMKLRLSLAHEEDLLGFLDELAGTVSSVLRVRACAMERRSDPEIANARLVADCTVDWITLKERA